MLLRIISIYCTQRQDQSTFIIQRPAKSIKHCIAFKIEMGFMVAAALVVGTVGTLGST